MGVVRQREREKENRKEHTEIDGISRFDEMGVEVAASQPRILRCRVGLKALEGAYGKWGMSKHKTPIRG